MALSKNFARALIWMLLGLGALSHGALAVGINVLQQTATMVEVESTKSLFKLDRDTFYVSFKLPNGNTTRPFQSTYTHIEESFRYKLDPAATQCYFLSPIHNLSNWQVSFQPATANFPATITSTAVFGYNNWCKFINRFYITDDPTTIQSSGKDVQISPGEIKFSFNIENCTSLHQLRLDPNLASVDPNSIIAVGRYGGPRMRVSAIAPPSQAFSLLPLNYDFQQINETGNLEFYANLCAQPSNYATKMGPYREVPADYNFTRGLTLPLTITEQGYTFQLVMKYLTWAYSDDAYYTQPSLYVFLGNLPNLFFKEVISPELTKYSIDVTVKPTFHNLLEYDPSISILFEGGDPAGSPGQTEFAASGAIAGGIVAAIVVVAIIGVLMIPSVRRKVFPFLQRRGKTTAHSSSDDEVPLESSSGRATSPAQSPSNNQTMQNRAASKGGWTTASTPGQIHNAAS